MAKANYPGPPEARERYEAVVAGLSELKGATTPYTSLNGHMFSFLDTTGSLGLRLPTELRDRFIDEFASALVVQHGRQMAEYVAVPDSLLADTERLRPWFEASHLWVSQLKPKATKRPAR